MRSVSLDNAMPACLSITAEHAPRRLAVARIGSLLAIPTNHPSSRICYPTKSIPMRIGATRKNYRRRSLWRTKNRYPIRTAVEILPTRDVLANHACYSRLSLPETSLRQPTFHLRLGIPPDDIDEVSDRRRSLLKHRRDRFRPFDERPLRRPPLSQPKSRQPQRPAIRASAAKGQP